MSKVWPPVLTRPVPRDSFAASPAGDTFSVVPTATDDDGASDAESQSVAVSAGGGDVITLVALNAGKGRNRRAYLTWSGPSAASANVHRDGAVVATTANDGQRTDVLPQGSSGTFTCRVCNTGTSTRSDNANVTF